jgi:hypothetical protein
MNPDIVRKIKHAHLKGTFETLTLGHRFFLIVFLFSLLSSLLPHITLAQVRTQADETGPILAFDTGNTDYQDYLDQLNQELAQSFYQQQLQQQSLRRDRLTEAVKIYLEQHNSPMAPYAAVLVTLRNWKKIVALSNAESTMCRRYPVDKSNCWGVGGSDLWDMGDNLGQGVIAMNRFLNLHPKRSHVKYSQMSFEEMNGLYKQPPAQHWIDNNQIVYDELVILEQSIQ